MVLHTHHTTHTRSNCQAANPSGANKLAICNQEFSSGTVEVEFRLEEEAGTCFGFIQLPVQTESYTASNLLLFRSYTGDLYGPGKAQNRVQEQRKPLVVKLVLDMDAKTMQVICNGTSLGITHKGFTFSEVPCVAQSIWLLSMVLTQRTP